MSEIDRSAIPARPLVAGAAILGPTVKGPVNVPTKVTSFQEYSVIFGTTFIPSSGSTVTREFLTSMAVKDYFSQGGDSLLVTRVANSKAFKVAGNTIIYSSGSTEPTSTPFELRTLSAGAIMNSCNSATYVTGSGGVLPSGSADNLRFEIYNVDEDRGTFALAI